jgi:glutamyl-tRNA synthetase
MQELIVVVDEITDFTSMNIEIIVKTGWQENEIGMGKVMQPFRLSLFGAKALTYLTSLSLLGKKKRSQEFKSCSKFIKVKVR